MTLRRPQGASSLQLMLATGWQPHTVRGAISGISDGELEIIWRDHGWQELAGELLPGTIGAELQEWEQQEVEA